MRLKLATAALLCAIATPAMAQDMMSFFDANGDGKVTAEEYAAAMDQGWGFIGGGADKVKVSEENDMQKNAFQGVTPDADGYVTKAAFIASVPARFKAADKNGDGVLDKDELTASMGPPPGAGDAGAPPAQ